jgi:hypothetical protein
MDCSREAMRCPDCGAPTKVNSTVEDHDSIGRPMTHVYRVCANLECGRKLQTFEVIKPDIHIEKLVCLLVHSLDKKAT